MEKEFVRIKTAATIVDRSPKTVRRWLSQANGKIIVRRPGGGAPLIHLGSLLDWIIQDSDPVAMHMARITGD